MADYSLSLQKGLVAYLKTVPALTAIIGTRVYDEPPQTVTFPYARIGAIEPTPLRSDCGTAATVTFGIEIYSRPKSGRVEASQAAQAVREALDGYALPLDGLTAVTMRWRTQTVNRDADGQSYIAIIAFTTILDA
jgi:hypothetical protein